MASWKDLHTHVYLLYYYLRVLSTHLFIWAALLGADGNLRLRMYVKHYPVRHHNPCCSCCSCSCWFWLPFLPISSGCPSWACFKWRVNDRFALNWDLQQGMIHLKALLPFSCTSVTCLCILLLQENVIPQMGQANGRLPSWTTETCVFLLKRSGNDFSQWWHLNGLDFKCIFCWSFRKDDDLVKLPAHSGHVWEGSVSCSPFICRLRDSWCMNVALQPG